MDITFHIPAKPILMYGNAQDLDSLVTNLLTNAIKFSHPGGWVTCCLQAVGGRARLQVKDNGLGLTIVKSILEAHSGDISVESTHLVGTTFTVNLPLMASPDSEPSARSPRLSITNR